MALDFPNSPTNGQTFTSGGRIWSWSSTQNSWQSNTGTQGTQGVQGLQGTQGIQGAQGAGGTIAYWGSFYDTTNQTAANTTTAYPVNIGSYDPNSNGVQINNGNQVYFVHGGTYNIQFSIQFANTDSAVGNSEVWFRKNGTDIPASAGEIAIPSKHGSTNGLMLASYNLVLALNAGDYLQLMWRVDSTSVTIQTLAAGTNPVYPVSPGVILTATQVTYTQVGPQGTQGIQGNQGITGAQGIQGITGAQGIQGITGTQGITGAQGIQGIQGASVQGIQGIQGISGTNGVQGIQGIQGTQGTQGITGAQGIQGIQGNNGTQGIQGIQGTSIQGTQGIQGIQGNYGNQGIQGIQGTSIQGTQGIQGIQGLTGIQGTAGFVGSNGSQGAQGSQGYTGPQGTTGAGTQGTSGASILGSANTWTGTNNFSATMKFPNNTWNQSSSDSQNRLYFSSSGNTYISTGASFIFRNSSDSGVLTINSGGNLNVATSSDSLSSSYALTVGGTGYASNDFRAPTFYSSSNTGYYVIPSGTSNLNALNVGGNAVLTSGAYDQYVSDYNYTHGQITSDSGDFNQSAFSQRSALGSISANANTPFGSAWYTYYNARHRGGASDGTAYGSQIVIGMTNYTNRLAFRNMYSTTWGAWNEVSTVSKAIAMAYIFS